MQHLILANGNKMPQLGFGTWQLNEGEEAYQAVSHALKIGYTHIDTAQVYGNERSVGQAIVDSGMARDSLFLTTKVWNNRRSYEETLISVGESLAKLQTDYLDLLLIHWPNPLHLRESIGWQAANDETWRAFEHLYMSGKVKAIGVSNFMAHHLNRLLEKATIAPHVNQIMLAPGCNQEILVDLCRQQKIIVQAYSPLGSGGLLDNEALRAVADKVGYSPAQVALRWSIQKEFAPLPRSSKVEHIRANAQIWDFQLSTEDMEILDKIKVTQGQSDPDQVDF